jgi:hypothetical protein
MSTAGLINRYVWFVTTIYNRGPITLEEIQHRFESHFGRGEELSERQFHRYTDAVEELFDIEIKYSRSQRGYVVADREGIDNMGMRNWLLQTFSVNGMLHESQELKNRILLEEVPSGQQHLTTIVDAMRESVALSMTYHSFHREEPSTFEVEPYCVKLFEQRWYMLGKSEGYDELRLYALDRIKALEPTERKFKLPKKFDAAKFFEDYYGIIIGDEDFDVEPVALKVDSWQSKYLRTLPLHHTQVEVERNEEYSIFEYRLCPTFDFRQKLLSMGDSVGVLAPMLLRTIIREKAEQTVENNTTIESYSEYKFKVYKK